MLRLNRKDSVDNNINYDTGAFCTINDLFHGTGIVHELITTYVRIVREIIFPIIYFRSNINLHLHNCPDKALECQVPGCKRIMKRRDITEHLLEAATSHFSLQTGEIQRLRQVIHGKVTTKCCLNFLRHFKKIKFCITIPSFNKHNTQATQDCLDSADHLLVTWL